MTLCRDLSLEVAVMTMTKVSGFPGPLHLHMYIWRELDEIVVLGGI